MQLYVHILPYFGWMWSYVTLNSCIYADFKTLSGQFPNNLIPRFPHCSCDGSRPAASALHHLFAISSNNIRGIEEHCLEIAVRPKTWEGTFTFTFAPYLPDKMVNMISFCAFDHLFAISSHNIQGIETIKKSRVEKF